MVKILQILKPSIFPLVRLYDNKKLKLYYLGSLLDYEVFFLKVEFHVFQFEMSQNKILIERFE